MRDHPNTISPGVVDPSLDDDFPTRSGADAAVLILDDSARAAESADPLTPEELEAGLEYIQDAYGYTDEQVAALRRKITS